MVAVVSSDRSLAVRHWVFLGTLVALDFAFGLLFKTVTEATGISKIIRIEMVIPIALMLLARLTVDRFGAVTAYELAWATLAIFAMPKAVLPGPLKLIPALFQGLGYDLVLSLTARWPRTRLLAGAIFGHLLSSLVVMLSRVLLMGMPWSNLLKFVLGWQLLTSLIVSVLAAILALLVWRRIGNLPLTRMLRVGP